MKNIKVLIIYLFFSFVFISTLAEGFNPDPEAVALVSKVIAEGKLMEERSKAQGRPSVYVTSSLSRLVEKGSGEGVGVVRGLSAFDNDYTWIKTEGDIVIINTARDIAIGTALGQYIPEYGSFYSLASTVKTMWEIANAKTSADFYRATSGTPAWHLGAAVKILDTIKIPDSFTAQSRVLQSLPPTFSSTWKTAKLGDMTVEYPSISGREISKMRWSIPKTHRNIQNINSLPRYTTLSKMSTIPPYASTISKSMDPMPKISTYSTYSMPKISVYTAKIPYSSLYPPPNILFSVKNPLTIYTVPVAKIPTYTLPHSSLYPPPTVLFSVKNPLTTYTPPVTTIPSYTPPRIPTSLGGKY